MKEKLGSSLAFSRTCLVFIIYCRLWYCQPFGNGTFGVLIRVPPNTAVEIKNILGVYVRIIVNNVIQTLVCYI